MTAVLPPTALSTMAIRLVGTCMNFIPLWYIAAAKPVVSPGMYRTELKKEILTLLMTKSVKTPRELYGNYIRIILISYTENYNKGLS